VTPERWQQVKAHFRSALEQKAEDRAGFLERACAGDDDLRREVELLLASYEESDSAIETAVAEAAARLLSDDRPESLVGQRLGHYEVTALLGEGGMGTVYQATDGRLGRKVALKLMPPDFTRDADRLERFEREARLTSSLNHPSILTVYEVGEENGVHFIAAELVEGETLRERMTGAPMEIGDLLAVAEQVASALATAHEAGIMHRDVKPENVMVRRDSLVKVLDFGLAKLIEPRAADVAAMAHGVVKTGPGVVMGTVPYMSPEQVLGRDVDHRSDLFSLGVLLYEMATGRPPFAGPTAGETADRILHAPLEAMAHVNPEVPAELERVVKRCLEKERDRRYGSARELLVDLTNLKRDLEVGATATATEGRGPRRRPSLLGRRLAASAAVALAAALGYTLLFQGAATEVAPEITSVAVLPLANLTGDPAEEYFADAMTESVISNLGQIRALRVTSRTSVMRYKGSSKSLPEIARELDVDAVVEGTVQRAGGRVRVTAQLIHAATDTHLWARDYERDLTDVLKLQGEIARAVADEIRVRVTPDERARLTSAHSIDVRAHEAYLLGRFHSGKGNEESWKRAIEYYERAIEFAPDYAAAYAGLSDAWLQRGIFGAGFKEVEAESRNAAFKAIELDGRLAEAHLALANVKLLYDWDWAGAEQEFRRTLELDPGRLDARISYGHLLIHLGRQQEAIGEAQTAVRSDPVMAGAHSALGWFLYRAKRYEEALLHLERAVELEPRSAAAGFRLGIVYAQMGRYDEAIAAFERIGALMPDSGDSRAGIAYVYAMTGRQREARRMIAGLRANPYVIAAVYATLGDRDAAFGILERAVEERQLLVAIKSEQAFESLHSDRRWPALLRRMNFPPT
jgi:serine/threonine protein kinase/Tfp pilus assembly protein PilF